MADNPASIAISDEERHGNDAAKVYHSVGLIQRRGLREGCSTRKRNRIVGVRNAATGQTVTNVFDDVITVSYKVGGEWQYKEWTNTTDPGKKGVQQFHNAKGVARLVEGQYRGSHTIRLHQGKYEALGQAKNVKVYRDANKDLNQVQVFMTLLNH